MAPQESRYDLIFDHCMTLIELSNRAMERGEFRLSMALFTQATTTLKFVHYAEKIKRLGGRLL
jgi:hypothetical protein